ncbi:hypothetical protein IQ255_05350, partial [Pleurocapsales cyanobacterium LEGE 10410]|nr:hypothetical protein [Pleurocapsales cyanobacterium LEGE 10410]
EIRNRGISALGHSVVQARPAYAGETPARFLAQNVCGLDATGSIGNGILVGTERSRNPKS